MDSFGDEVRRLMTVKGMSQQQLATAAGIHQTFVSKLLRGEKTRLGADVMFRLADALDVGCEHFKPYFPETGTVKPDAKKPRKGKK
jgi:transcriptional regulator with XRE-family HTH domain